MVAIDGGQRDRGCRHAGRVRRGEKVDTRSSQTHQNRNRSPNAESPVQPVWILEGAGIWFSGGMATEFCTRLGAVLWLPYDGVRRSLSFSYPLRLSYLGVREDAYVVDMSTVVVAGRPACRLSRELSFSVVFFSRLIPILLSPPPPSPAPIHALPHPLPTCFHTTSPVPVEHRDHYRIVARVAFRTKRSS
ncbi:hypothetical protein LY76DRAFT_196740 [Colletotrichum caudatum]|nr:hypothetical protein LY76DRAFT_196740 [Colletotrichum caudatum]